MSYVASLAATAARPVVPLQHDGSGRLVMDFIPIENLVVQRSSELEAAAAAAAPGLLSLVAGDPRRGGAAVGWSPLHPGFAVRIPDGHELLLQRCEEGEGAAPPAARPPASAHGGREPKYLVLAGRKRALLARRPEAFGLPPAWADGGHFALLDSGLLCGPGWRQRVVRRRSVVASPRTVSCSANGIISTDCRCPLLALLPPPPPITSPPSLSLSNTTTTNNPCCLLQDLVRHVLSLVSSQSGEMAVVR